MDSDKFLKEKLDNLNGQIDDLKREKKEPVTVGNRLKLFNETTGGLIKPR